MLDDAHWTDEPKSHEVSELDVELVPAAEDLANANSLSARQVLSRLLTDYWNGEIAFYTLRPCPGDDINEFDDVVSPVSASTLPYYDTEDDYQSEPQWVVTVQRQKFDWPREKLLFALKLCKALPPEYDSTDQTFHTLSRQDLFSLEQVRWYLDTYLQMFYVERSAIVAWCKRQKLSLPHWPKPRRATPKGIAPAKVRRRIESFLHANAHATKDLCFQAITAEVPGLSGNSFNKLWKDVTSKPDFERFSRSGRRPKR